MGSPPAPHIANGWLSKNVKGDAKIYSRFMDDILRDIKEYRIDEKLREINGYHPNLTFTIEKEKGASLWFLDMKISRKDGKLTSTWYTKATDTGLTINYHALAPLRYKNLLYLFLYREFSTRVVIGRTLMKVWGKLKGYWITTNTLRHSMNRSLRKHSVE